jgi:hypothetical protein
MSYTLAATVIKRPTSIDESNDTQVVQQRTLSGTISRDYFGSNKRVWVLSYNNCNITDFNIINNIYQTYLSTGTTQTWAIDETNYTVSSTNVHLDLKQRGFRISGSSYISDFDLILTEA